MLKKLILLVIVGFVLYYLLTAPEGAARAVGDAWDATLGAFAQVGVFIDSLFGT